MVEFIRTGPTSDGKVLVKIFYGEYYEYNTILYIDNFNIIIFRNNFCIDFAGNDIWKVKK